MSADEVEASVAYKAKAGLPFPLLSDPELEAVKAWGVTMDGADIAVPTVYIINKSGITWTFQSDTQFDRPMIKTMRQEVNKALQ